MSQPINVAPTARLRTKTPAVMRNMFRPLLCILVLLLLAGCGTEGVQPTAAGVATVSPTVASPTMGPAPTVAPDAASSITGMFDVGGHKLFLDCNGTGSPTVVLLHGNGSTFSDWIGLPNWIKRSTRVCFYDRAGIGKSEAGPRPTTSLQMAQELHSLLAVAQVPGPYLLVGWSLGGLNALLYAHEYPDEVAGLVLLESAIYNQNEREIAVLPPQTPGESTGLKNLRAIYDEVIWEPEGVDWPQTAVQGRVLTSLGDLFLVVVTRSPASTADDPPGLEPELARLLRDEWQKMQADLLQLSTNSRQVIAEAADHCIHCSEMKLVVDTINSSVEELR